MDFLLNGLHMGDTADARLELSRIFDRAIPVTQQDMVLIKCTAVGWRNGLLTEESEVRRILP